MMVFLPVKIIKKNALEDTKVKRSDCGKGMVCGQDFVEGNGKNC